MGTRVSNARQPFDYAAQWVGPTTTKLDLPSGKRVEVRAADLPRLAKRGRIPADLLPVVERFVLRGVAGTLGVINGDGEGLPPGERLSTLADFHAYVDAFCVASVVEPPLGFEGEADVLPVTRLDPEDRMHIWRWGAGLLQPEMIADDAKGAELATLAAE